MGKALSAAYHASIVHALAWFVYCAIPCQYMGHTGTERYTRLSMAHEFHAKVHLVFPFF